MPGTLALLLILAQAPTVPVYAPPTSAPPTSAPVVAPANGAPVYGPPVYAPPPYGAPGGSSYPPYGQPGYPSYGYVPPVDPDDRLEWLEARHGARYTEDRGKGMLVGGGLTLGFGALMGLSALTCVVTWAAMVDGGDADARAMGAIAAGLGAAAVVATGVGAPLVVIGKQRRRAYRAWLERQPIVGVGGGGLVLRF